jgi:cyclophilin family peptidyl-prolyl cis-trans isomerase
MKTFLLVTTFCLCASLAAQDKPAPPKAPSPVAAAPAVAVPAVPVAPPPAVKPKPRVQIDTSYGPIVVELEPDLAPRTVANFLQYVSEGFYDNTIWHRVIEGFMIQGGGLLTDLTEKPTHAPISNEAPETSKAGLLNTRGTIAMARQDKPQSATAQFYINTVDNNVLDHRDLTDAGFGYCVFGRVISGMEAVDKIVKVHTGWRHGMQNVPEYSVRIKSARRLPDAN